MGRRLIFNADDYGLSAEVDEAIEELAGRGAIRDVSILANGPGFERAAGFLGRNPGISAGVHLNVVEGVPLANSPASRILTGAGGRFAGRATLMVRWALYPASVTAAIEEEWSAQIERVRQAGVGITHLDSHQHFHCFPPAWRIAARLARRYGIKAMRLPRERGLPSGRILASLALDASLALCPSIGGTGGIFINDNFLGFRRAGGYGADELRADLRAIPEAVTELALHPSLRDGSPYPHFRGNAERLAVADPRLQVWLAENEIELTTWRDISST